ncbi:MAG TPA: biopolymer transporter Tol [Syntrophomonadaceae bacterium]|nr:biopolymer transporter Tol [Syntrophomonadaceae bacterium]
MVISFKTKYRFNLRSAGLIAVLIGVILMVLWLDYGLKNSSPETGNGGLGASVTEKPAGVDYIVLKNQGDLAFIQDGTLQILEGSTGRLTKINANGQALQPKWSHDGQWLAYLIANQQNLSLWVVKRDGTQLHPVDGLPEAVSYGIYKWSPTENVLAVSCQGIWLVNEQGQPKQVVKTGPDITPDITWSPDGQQIAYSLTLPYTPEEVEKRSDALYTMDIHSGQTVERLMTPAAGIMLAGWWPDGKGILYWEDPFHGLSIAADGLELCSLPLGAKEPFRLTAGLIKRSWLSLASDHRLLRVAGAGRQEWSNKWLEISDIATGTAVRVNLPQGSVPTDPSFSADGSKITFVTAPDLGSMDYPSVEKFKDWINSMTLWVANPDGSGARLLSKAGKSVQEPQWSKDGKYIMYMADKYLWMIDVQGDEPRRIAGPFSTIDDQADYYYGSGSDVWDWYRG